MDPKYRFCQSCKGNKPLNADHFKALRAEEFSKTCMDCLERRKQNHHSKKSNKENVDEIADSDDESSDDVDTTADFIDMSAVNLDVFLDLLSQRHEDIKTITARIDVTRIMESDMRTTADKVSEEIWECMKYRFHYHSVYRHKRTQSETFKYHCAQIDKRQHKPKKGLREGADLRDKGTMASFACNGWLSIKVHQHSPVVDVKLKHTDNHVPYWRIDVPEEIQALVKKNLKLSMPELWQAVLEVDPIPKYSQKAIYRLWAEQKSKEWKRDPDELKSAKILIDEASKDRSSLYSVENIPLHEEEGFTAIAFALPEMLRQWGGRIREIALDSTYNTNSSKYEVYALLGEIYGSGCPLGYLLINSTNGGPNGKERYISDLLNHFRTKWKLKPIITLTDKDLSEINAFLKIFPEAKHQLCFWHCLRAIKTRLAILRRKPKYYDVKEANMEFPWINKEFVPVSQRKDSEKTSQSQYIAQNQIPRLTIRLGGVLQNSAPDLPPSSGKRLVIRLNGVVQSVVPLPNKELDLPDSDNRPDSSQKLPPGRDLTGSDDPDKSNDESNDNDTEDEEGELLSRVDKLLENEMDAEDGPDWMFDDGELKSQDPNYVFCPAPHRKQILHLFTKHFCQHPLFAEKDGKWTARKIRDNAVYEMYTFCHTRGLSEVWGYMWACWYSPKMWKLWARSTLPAISRLRTTMTVENFWKQLKHDHLHNFHHPRLDHLVWILIKRVTAVYVVRGEILNDENRLGRTKTLTSYQKYFKKAWKKLLKSTVSDKVYDTRVDEWTCNCGRQKYDRHHLCKHLVQAVGTPPIPFWSQIYRRRALPIYRHPDLVSISDAQSDTKRRTHIEVDGSITDGDDHIWTGSREVLEGEGGWKTQLSKVNISLVLGKRIREHYELEDDQTQVSKKSKLEVSEVAKSAVPRDSDELHEATSTNLASRRSEKLPPTYIDLTMSSPPRIEMEAVVGAQDQAAQWRSSSPIAYGSDDEEDDDKNREQLKARAEILRQAADIMDGQAEDPGPDGRIWRKSVVERDIGRDAEFLVHDVQRFEETGRKRTNTWANSKSKNKVREMKNTMGYQRRR